MKQRVWVDGWMASEVGQAALLLLCWAGSTPTSMLASKAPLEVQWHTLVPCFPHILHTQVPYPPALGT